MRFVELKQAPRSGRAMVHVVILCAMAVMNLASVHGTEMGTEMPDPLGSPQWDFMHETMLDGEPFEFDNRVVVLAPESAEDALNVPVSFRIDGLADIQKIVVFADLNPIHKVLVYYPHQARPALDFRIKIEQGTPIRAAALGPDGVWHVGGV